MGDPDRPPHPGPQPPEFRFPFTEAQSAGVQFNVDSANDYTSLANNLDEAAAGLLGGWEGAAANGFSAALRDGLVELRARATASEDTAMDLAQKVTEATEMQADAGRARQHWQQQYNDWESGGS